MGLNNIRLGDYITSSTANNNELIYGYELIQGVTSEGIFAKPKVNNVESVNLKPYKIVKEGAFVYNPSRFDIGSLAYKSEGLCIVSHLYQIFYLNEEGKKKIVPEYLYIFLRRKEFQREITFKNFGSQRPEFNIKKLSDIIIPLPDYDIQKKYIDIYRSLVENQKSYENGLEDLKLTCVAYIENLRRSTNKVAIGPFIEEVNMKNKDSDNPTSNVKGVNNTGRISETKARSKDLSNYKIVEENNFAYNPSRINIGSIALLHENEERCAISPMYVVFKSKDINILYPEYLMLWLSRNEFFRSTLFYATGSVRDTFDYSLMEKVEIPIPDINTQKAIANIYKAYIERSNINNLLKEQIKSICPILYKGSIEEGRRI